MTKASNREREEAGTSNKGILANHSAVEAECLEPKYKRKQRRDYRIEVLGNWKQRISRPGKRKKKRMERYSERKMTRKAREEVSTLNPLTSSDSPSTKSKGERFDSAKHSTKRTRAQNGEKQTRARSLGPKTTNSDTQ